MTDEVVKQNVFYHPPTTFEHYEVDLTTVVSFDGFDPKNYRQDELSVLQPQLELLGYRVVYWMDKHPNYLVGFEGRFCRALDPNGKSFYFFYE